MHNDKMSMRQGNVQLLQLLVVAIMKQALALC